ncbi:PAS domain S-box protein [Paenibacillus rhizovicinus]|uniref:histidine kinase n=1 Tax=Paenibacillus rhizovicinus TaxID=2704463 RepID=A0A6C0P118_9BACL|nr:ATP-binding protein [Paenibacillus rhizovicinus]QHW31593.1 PAS domain S-box protein [Paenibacillus rhizovicinus]
MIEPIFSDSWKMIALAMVIQLFASITVYGIIGHLNRARVKQHYWQLSGALVYALGVWVSHIIVLLTTNVTIDIDWTTGVKLFGIMICTYGSFRLLDSRIPYGVRLLGGSVLMAFGANLVMYASLPGQPSESFSIDPAFACFTFLFSLIGTASSFYLYERKTGYAFLPGLLLGISGMIMELFGLSLVGKGETVILTADRLNDYMQLLSVVLGLATLVIFAFSIVARYVDRRYVSMNERYKLLVENSIDMIAVIQDERWEYINHSGLRIFEAEGEHDLLGKSIYMYLQPRFHAAMKMLLQASRQKERKTPIEMDWISVEGKTLHTEVIVSGTKLSGKPVIQVIIRDISERKKNEELLINSEKLYVAGQLAAGIAHEIRNPLTSLKGFLQLITSGRSGKNYYDIMQSELTRIESIVSELLMLSKPQIYELTHMDIRTVMSDTITLLDAQAILHDITIEASLGEETLWAHGVENQLKQVFINVIKNAIEVMMDGGVIKVTCLLDEIGRIIVRIADRGPGIAHDQLAKIGQPFYTTKEKGTGLGLMVTYKIVDNHHGSIEVSSRIGEGTTFDILLPYHAPREAEATERSNIVSILRFREDNESAS